MGAVVIEQRVSGSKFVDWKKRSGGQCGLARIHRGHVHGPTGYCSLEGSGICGANTHLPKSVDLQRQCN